MNRKMLMGIGAFLLVAVGLSRAAGADAFIGTWKLNEAKSKITAGTAKSSTVVYAMDGDNIKCSIDATDGKGQAYHSEWTGKFDGKEYPVTGDPASSSRAYKMINDHTIVGTGKEGGKETLTAKIVVSADGKTRTVTVTTTDAAGKKVTSTAIYDKQ